MREVVFRAKDEHGGEWRYGYLDLERGLFQIHQRGEYYSRTVVRETIGEYTGLTDKKGVPVFEGDVLFDPYAGVDSCSVVTYDEDNAQFVGAYPGSEGRKDNIPLHKESVLRMEIVGNIYELKEEGWKA